MAGLRQLSSDGGGSGGSCTQENQLQTSELNTLKSQCCCRDLALTGLIRCRNEGTTSQRLQEPQCHTGLLQQRPGADTARLMAPSNSWEREWRGQPHHHPWDLVCCQLPAVSSCVPTLPSHPPDLCHTQTPPHREEGRVRTLCLISWSPSQAQGHQRRSKER